MNKVKNKINAKLPNGIKSLLWEYKFRGDIRGYESVLILRILQFGNMEQIKWMFNKFGYKRILLEFVRHGYRLFSNVNFDFWFKILKSYKKNDVNWVKLKSIRSSHKKLNALWKY